MKRQQAIIATLTEALKPLHLQVENESGKHSVPANSETHFKVTVVSEAFEGQGRVARHQGIYRLLAGELQAGLHALSLHTFTPTEWEATGRQSRSTPDCLGGSKAESPS